MAYQRRVSGNDGERDCEERSEMIRGELVTPGIVMDIGSAEGYFCRQIASCRNLLVVSVESDSGRVNVQRRWAAPLMGRVVICQKAFDVAIAGKLSSQCDFFENVLLLSVLHWMPQPDMIVKHLSLVSGKLFVELPDPADRRACGQDKIGLIGEDQQGWLEKHTGRSVRLIGKPKAHTSKTRNLWVIEGPFSRSPPCAFVNAPIRPDTYRLTWDGQKVSFEKSGKNSVWIPGVNLETLRLMGVIFPCRRWWFEKVGLELDKVIASGINHRDRRIWNVIAVNGGVRWIDPNLAFFFNTIEKDLKDFSVQ